MSTHILGSSHLRDVFVSYRRLPTPKKVAIWVGLSILAVFLIHSQRGPPHFRGPPRPPPFRPPGFYDHLQTTSPADKQLWDKRKNEVRDAFRHAYGGYEKFAFGFDELLPMSNGTRTNLNGWGLTIVDSLDTMLLMDLTPEVDRAVKFIQTLDFTKPSGRGGVGFFETMIRYVGGLLSGYYLTSISTKPGFQSTYAPVLLKKATELSTVLNGAFNTSSGLPDRWIKIENGTSLPSGPHGGGSLAEMATCQMEYKYLSHVTGDPSYFRLSQRVMEVMEQEQGKTPARVSTKKPDGTVEEELSTKQQTGLWLNSFYLDNGEMFGSSVSAGAMGDSAYEYLLKQYLLSGRTEKHILDMYLQAMDGVINHLLFLSPKNDLLYMTDLGSWATPSGQFEHLSCYMPGVLALGARLLDPEFPWDHRHRHHPRSPLESPLNVSSSEYQPPYSHRLRSRAPVHVDQEQLRRTLDLHMRAAEGLAYTCWSMYASTKTGIGPETVTFHSPDPPEHLEGSQWLTRDRYNPVKWGPRVDKWERSGRQGPLVGTDRTTEDGIFAEADKDWTLRDERYLLRPEAIEAMYLLWKTTGNKRWRDRGWQMFEAVNKHARTESGYASVHYVQNEEPRRVDDMPSFFLAETLKYAYLITVDPEDDPLPLDKIVFNTEAHPLPVFEWTAEERSKYNIH
ncbi:glycoside hydrolase family 47 protein [Serendipita vermifera MAFF 305830]|uniref:alpha-1,2-Mannosidase n=1 Tax=Serendipita vermifera MAFF 305830 TaxID=933852 RepID=A0A0C2WZ04_SERVB|nr:glycoside hydrolase family 47 protein [Serendipita vermifera MAFF 305830]